MQFQLIGIFLFIFVWSVNCSSLIIKLWILFWTFWGMWTVLKYYRMFRTVLYRKISFNWATFCWPTNCWISLNYKAYFKHVQKLKHYLCFRPFNVFSFRESSILTINYVFSFFLVFKLYKSGLQTIHFNSDHLRFLGSVVIGGFL